MRSRFFTFVFALLALPVRPASAATMALVATQRNGIAVAPSANPEIAPGDTLTIEIRLSNWGADFLDGKLRVFQAGLNLATAGQSGAGGTLLPPGWDAPAEPGTCQISAECPAATPVCDSDCFRCVGDDFAPSLGLILDCTAADHLFAAHESICAVGACALPRISYVGVLGEGGIADPGGGFEALLGKLILQASDDACGTFTLEFSPFNQTFIGGIDLEPLAVDSSSLMVTIVAGAEDCNANDEPDTCDVLTGSSADENANALPDECDLDLDGDRDVDLRDASRMVNCFGAVTSGCADADFHSNGAVNVADWAAMADGMTGPSSSSP